MKRLIIVLTFILTGVFTFGQNLPRRAPFFGSEPLVDAYPLYNVRKGYDMIHAGWILGDDLFLLSYESTDKKVGDLYLYSRNMSNSIEPFRKVVEKPIIHFYNNENSYYTAGFRTMGLKKTKVWSKKHWSDKEFTCRDTIIEGAGISRVEYLNKWDVHLVLLHVRYGCGERKLDRYIYVIPIFFVPQNNGKYKAYAFEPVDKYPQYLYYPLNGGIEYDEERNEYNIGYGKNRTNNNEDFRLYFTYNNEMVLISNEEYYKSSTIY